LQFFQDSFLPAVLPGWARLVSILAQLLELGFEAGFFAGDFLQGSMALSIERGEK